MGSTAFGDFRPARSGVRSPQQLETDRGVVCIDKTSSTVFTVPAAAKLAAQAFAWRLDFKKYSDYNLVCLSSGFAPSERARRSLIHQSRPRPVVGGGPNFAETTKTR